MEMERVTEFPIRQLDRRPRKRPRLGWDVLPEVPKAQLGLFCGQDVGSVTSYAPLRQPSNISSSLIVKEVAQNGSPPWREDDKDGHYMFELGENITSRYKIHSKMGEGTFGQVLECWDRERKEMVAIKIVRGLKKYREAAMIEVDVLQQLGKHDKDGNRCVQIRNWFDYRNHVCIVFEKLGPSLYDFLRKNNYRSFPIDLAREIGRQLLECVAFMHDLRLIHTDLKPENILLVSPDYVKVPDYKGGALFQTHENLEHLAMMEKVLGPIPAHMLKRADRSAEKYIRKGKLDWPEGAASRESIRAVLKLPRLQNLVMQHVDHSAGDLINLLQGLLRYDPSERLTAREALRHPFFSRDHLRRL
ncbi:unnamed protein product [Cuscuta epithymum]|uniref:Protein kinase domain-containing protein n=1 Tax=Cuscuta epithymum TaxID=186058 RepID=A0AAV0DXJ8_9ASTE|nr:unnamed protein product [Cuscuta epithymum]CAH9146088.1 unnamed protein product [Cuscuta epithymum]